MAWYYVLAIVVGGLLLLYTAFAWVASKKLLEMAVHPEKHTFDEARTFQTAQEGLDFSTYDSWQKQDFTLQTSDGITLSGTLVKNPESTGKAVILAHGFSWNRFTSVKYANMFYKMGYNVVLYDHRYFGQSSGSETTVGLHEKHDLSAVIDYVREIFGKDAVVGLHGESLGGVTVLGVLGLRSDIDFVVADCPFSDTFHYYNELCTHTTHLPGFPIVNFANVRSKRLYAYNFCDVSPIKDVKGSRVPVCFIHGEEDRYILPHHSVDMFAVAEQNASELHLISGARHARSFLQNNQKYEEIVTSFVQKIENNISTK